MHVHIHAAQVSTNRRYVTNLHGAKQTHALLCILSIYLYIYIQYKSPQVDATLEFYIGRTTRVPITAAVFNPQKRVLWSARNMPSGAGIHTCVYTSCIRTEFQ